MKRFLCLILVSLLLICTVSCGKKKEDSGYKIYYLSTDKLSIVPVDFKYSSDDTTSMIRDALKALSTETTEIDYMMTIPSGVDIHEWDLTNGNLSLFFTGEYYSLDTYTEILVRAATVKTLVQIDGVDSVSFYVDNAPLSDASGTLVGSMTNESFIDDFGEETDSLLSTTLKLYFASADGKTLASETREVYYSRNVTLEKLIVEQLLKGPESSELLSAIPADTKLNSISITDGVCYVNFDATLETAITGITENATVFSIVNSLTELDQVKQVQILVNGEKPHLSNVDVDLSGPISKNKDIIHKNVPEATDTTNVDSNGDALTDDTASDDTVEITVDSESNANDSTNEEEKN